MVSLFLADEIDDVAMQDCRVVSLANHIGATAWTVVDRDDESACSRLFVGWGFLMKW